MITANRITKFNNCKSKQAILSYKGLLISIVIYAFLFSAGPVVMEKGNLYHILQFISAISILYFGYKEFSKNNFYRIDGVIKVLIVIFFLWQLIQVLRGVLSDMSIVGISHAFLYPRYALYYLSPAFCFMAVGERRLHFFFKLFCIAFAISLIIVFSYRNVLAVAKLAEIASYADYQDLTIYNYFSVAGLPMSLVMGIGFLIINNKWHNQTNRIFVLFSIIIAVVIVAWLGRRGATVRFFVILFFIFLLNVKKKPIWLFFSGVLFLMLLIFIERYFKDFLNLFPILSERLFEDTRSWAENEFYMDFNGDVGSYLFGRGSYGTYFSPTFGQRGVIETGYLDIILHSGLIGLVLHVSILLCSFWKGFFESNNRLVNAMALYLLAQIAFLYPTTPIGLDLSTYSVWACIAVCSSKSLRKTVSF